MTKTRPNRPRPCKPLLALLAIACALTTAAQDARQYQVEIVVFRHTEPATGGELWERPPRAFFQDTIQADVDASTEYEDSDEEPALTVETLPGGVFELIAADSYKFGDAIAKLSQASRFSPLVHEGWTQPGLPFEESRAKNIVGRDARSRVTGRVVLSRGRYLHLDFDLTLATNEREYRLQQSRRRIQTNRFHYIDHPLFSVIAVVSPAPVEEPVSP